MPIKIIKNSFNSGELSPMIDGRTDLSKYYSGCTELVNATATPSGGIVKRSGTIYVATTKKFADWAVDVLYPVGCVVNSNGVLYYCNVEHTSGDGDNTTLADDITDNSTWWTEVEEKDGDSSKVKCFSFEFNITDSHILEFGTRYMRVYKNHERVFETATRAISAITKSGTSPLLVTTSANHLWKTGDTVKFTLVSGMTELNGKEYVIQYNDVNKFYLVGTDSSDFTDYSGTDGTISKVYEITTPFDSEDVFDIHKASSADVVFIASENYWPQKLSRLDDDSWTLEDAEFERVPFLTENVDSTKTLVFAATGNSTALTVAFTNKGGIAVTGISTTPHGFTTGDLVRIAGTTDYNGDVTVTVVDDDEFYFTDTYTSNQSGTAQRLASGYYFPVGVTGTLTAAGTGNTPFLASHVGSYWLVKHTREDNTTSTVVNSTNAQPTTLANSILIKGDFTFDVKTFATDEEVYLWRKEGNGAFQKYRPFTAATAYSSTEETDDVYYCFTRYKASSPTSTGILTAKRQEHYGVVLITGITNSTVVSCTVVDSIYRTGATGTSSGTTAMWAEGAWSDYRGFPRTVCFYEERLYWAATTYNPQTIWGSKVGAYLDHTTGETDEDAISMTLNANDISQIQWLAARQSMIVGTASGEFVLSASNPDDPMTATDKKSRPASNFGSISIQPLVLNNGLFYFQRQGRKLQVMTYQYVENNFKSEDATLLASHILEVSPVCAAVQSIPDSLLWIVRADGSIAAFCYEPSEQVFAAWSRCVTGSLLITPYDLFESCAVIHGDTEDELWTSVKRTITENAVSKAYRYIEYCAPRLIDTIDEAVCVDSAITADTGYSTKTIIAANDNIRFGAGIFGSGTFGI
jgi:hypothetical protein